MDQTKPLKDRARRIRRKLESLYPEAECALNHENPLQLLIATILSAQCTDARVNQITPALFQRYGAAQDFADADAKELQKYIKTTGFFRNKAKSIMLCCRQLVERHGGEVPATMDELVQLRGVGRKTANVILGNAFGQAGVTVDTHVGRLSRRLGLTTHKDPVKVEGDLMAILPRKHWTAFSHGLILHGRRVCHARKPNCAECGLARLCPKNGVADSVYVSRNVNGH